MGAMMWAACVSGASAEDVLGYFTYGNKDGTTPPQKIKYVKVKLEDAWNKIAVPALNDQCDQEGKPNIRMSVLKNTLPAQQPNRCDMTNLKWWRGADQQFNEYRFLVSANFYNAAGDYNDACGQGLGVSIHDTTWISGENVDDRKVHGTDTHTLVIYNQVGREHFQKYADIVNTTYDFIANKQYIRGAIAGYRFMNNGAFVAQPIAISPNGAKPRAAVGLSQDGETLIFIAINEGTALNNGEDLKETGKFYKALDDLGAYNALNLDGAGSAQLILMEADADVALLRTKASDVRNSGQGGGDCPKRFYRPIPVVMGVE